jgi:hypothetical protein
VLVLRRLFDQVVRDFAELFQSGFEVFDDFLGNNVWIGDVVGFFEAFVSQRKSRAGFLAAVKAAIRISIPT